MEETAIGGSNWLKGKCIDNQLVMKQQVVQNLNVCR
jgi:hypothetical protein